MGATTCAAFLEHLFTHHIGGLPVPIIHLHHWCVLLDIFVVHQAFNLLNVL